MKIYSLTFYWLTETPQTARLDPDTCIHESWAKQNESRPPYLGRHYSYTLKTRLIQLDGGRYFVLDSVRALLE
jgi:hypothetical protein